MGWIVVHVANSGQPLLVDEEEISQIGVGNSGGNAIIHRTDGGSVEVLEDFRDFAYHLNAKGIEKCRRRQSNQNDGLTKKPTEVEEVDSESKSPKTETPSKGS